MIRTNDSNRCGDCLLYLVELICIGTANLLDFADLRRQSRDRGIELGRELHRSCGVDVDGRSGRHDCRWGMNEEDRSGLMQLVELESGIPKEFGVAGVVVEGYVL
jgi:hypothetical protein